MMVLLLRHWRIAFFVVGFLSVWGWHRYKINEAWSDGRNALIEEQVEDAKRRNADAEKADADARRCAADPGCRVQNDGFRRD